MEETFEELSVRGGTLIGEGAGSCELVLYYDTIN